MSEVTKLLNQLESGDPSASEELLPLVYRELRQLAAARLSHEKPGQTLQATALVHEAYLRLVGKDLSPSWNSRGHFFGAAAEAMRRILIENARRKQQVRRGGSLKRVEFEDGDAIAAESAKLLEIDDALTKLEEQDPRAAKIVELRYFAGLTMQQTANSLGISLRSAERDWTYARTWMRGSLSDEAD